MNKNLRLVRRATARLGAFGATIALNLASGIVTFPLVIAFAGADVWARLAVAQSIGSLSAVAVGWGWNVMGPAIVAAIGPDSRSEYFFKSLAARCWVFVLVAPLTALVLLFVDDGDLAACILTATAIQLTSLGASWFYVGEARPGKLFNLSTLPTVAGSLLSCVILGFTGSVILLAVTQVVTALIVLGLCTVDIARRYGRPKTSLRPSESIRTLASASSGVVTVATSALYVNGPLIVVNFLVPSATPVFAMADRLLRYSRSALSAVTQVTQGYVPAGRPDELRERARQSLLLGATVGVGSGIAFALLAPLLSSILSGGRLVAPIAITIPLGVSLGAVAVSSILGLSILTTLGLSRWVAFSTMVGASVGITGMLALGIPLGTPGIATAVAIAEVTVLSMQLLILRRGLKEISLRGFEPSK